MRHSSSFRLRHSFVIRISTFVIFFLFILHPSSFILPALAQRYTAAWEDGSQTSGDELGPWHDTASAPQLAGRPLFGKPSVRWVQDNTLQPARLPEARVELVGGDVLPGRVLRLRGAESRPVALPMHLLVGPSPALEKPSATARPPVRVLARWVRRIVLQPAAADYRPATLFTREGRRIAFRAIRFGEDVVRLLLEEGLQEVALAEIAELHMPAVDPWEAYFDQLAALAPEGQGRLIFWETSDGLRVTGASTRFQAGPPGYEQDPGRWFHMLQPAWSLDPLWVSFRKIRLRQYFSPDEAPLSRFAPLAVRQQSELGGSWRWQTDRNVEGGPLASGGRGFAWGLGVHATSELEFALPECALSFRSRLGLDSAVGDGGCVQAALLALPLRNAFYESPLIVGSRQVLDTGRLALGDCRPGRRMILRVDAAHRQRPAGADPLDVRDHFDWLEPELGLDRSRLRAEIFRRAPRLVEAWSDWSVQTAGAPGARLASQWFAEPADRPGYRLLASAADGPLVVARGLQVGPAGDLLLIAVARPADSPATRIEVRVDSRPAVELDVPLCQPGRPIEPVQVSLSEYRGRQVQIQITQRPKTLVEWERIELGEGK